MNYLPQHTSLEEAYTALGALDWPGSVNISCENATGELFWLPYDPATCLFSVDPGQYPAFSGLNIKLQAEGEDMPEDLPGSIVPSTGEGPVLYIPLWMITDHNDENSYAVVEANKNFILSGSLPAAPIAAMTRLAFCIGITLFNSFLGGGLVFLMLAMLFSMIHFLKLMMGDLIPAILIIISGSAVIAWFSYRMSTLVPAILYEPTCRAAANRINLPLDRTWLSLVRVSGYLVLSMVPLTFISAFQYNFKECPLGIILLLINMALELLYARYALRISKGDWISNSALPVKNKPQLPPKTGMIPQLVWTFFYVTLLSLAGILFGGVIAGSGLLAHLTSNNMVIMAYGAELGAIIALFITPMSKSERIVAIAGCISISLSRHLIPHWSGGFVSFAVITLLAFFAFPASGGEKGKNNRGWNALRLSWGFSFGALLGAFFGRLLALFFLGPYGMRVGEILGERVMAVLFFLGQENAIKKTEPPSPGDH